MKQHIFIWTFVVVVAAAILGPFLHSWFQPHHIHPMSHKSTAPERELWAIYWKAEFRCRFYDRCVFASSSTNWKWKSFRDKCERAYWTDDCSLGTLELLQTEWRRLLAEEGQIVILKHYNAEAAIELSTTLAQEIATGRWPIRSGEMTRSW